VQAENQGLSCPWAKTESWIAIFSLNRAQWRVENSAIAYSLTAKRVDSTSRSK